MASDLMRLSGINSGYDTESMIQAMMSTYQTKIDNQQKRLTKLSWQQEAYRDVTSKLTTFKNKYFDILNKDNYLLSPSSFKKFNSTISSKLSGSDANGLSVSTTQNTLETSYKVKVDQLATAASVKGASISSGAFSLDLDKAAEFSLYSTSDSKTDADGNPIATYDFALDVKVGSVTKSVEFSVEASVKDGVVDTDSFRQSALESLNKSLQKAFGYSGRKDGDATAQTDADGNEWYIQARADGGKLTFDIGGNASATITEKVGNFGLAEKSEKVSVYPGSVVTGTNTFTVDVDGKTKNVSFNGVSTTYYESKDLPGNEAINNEYLALKKAAYIKENKLAADAEVSEKELSEFKYSAAQAAKDKNTKAISEALNKEFSEDGITFSYDGANVTAKKDGEAVELSITAVYGGTLGVAKGSEGNKFTAKSKLSDMGIAANTDDGGYSFEINGERIALSYNATIDDLMTEVNKSGAGVEMTYSALTNSFELTAKNMGSAEEINITANALTDALGLTKDGSAVNYTAGQNSVFEINGEKIYHNSNSFTTDGTTFNFDEDIELGDTYTVGLSKSYDDVKQSIKDFITDYNKLIEDVYGYTGTAPARDSKNNLYEPLTDAQREEMSEDEIEKWEKTAKQGVLYNDTTVTGIMSKIRTALYSSVDMGDGKNFGLYSMGIKTSSEYKEHGKLELDESAFDAAFEKYGDEIVKLFTDSTSSVMKKVNDIIDSAVRTTSTNRGTLVQKAGIEKGASATDNYIYRQMQSINTRIAQLQKRYDAKEEYWWGVFTNLENMMGDFNSQTSYISSYFGGGNYV